MIPSQLIFRQTLRLFDDLGTHDFNLESKILPFGHLEVMLFEPTSEQMCDREQSLGSGNTPTDVHKNDDFFTTDEQFPGSATHCPLSQYGLLPLQFIVKIGVSTRETHA